ncbi:MAG TPA: methyltransferase domain-containing protein, partial [Hyphomicrobiales bacterium]|nr:methyltransferase domain-containing protein [Hyphomicrobiales bacterium]
MPDFSRRARLAEWMDDPATDYPTFRACLADLARVNRLTLAYPPTLAFLDRVVRAGLVPRRRPLAILDAGSGDGDMLRAIDRWARRRGIAVALTGVDLNPWSARAAAAATPPGRPIAWITSDLFAYRPAAPPDLVISSLFTHHLDDGALVRFLAWMEANAATGWFVNDLHR